MTRSSPEGRWARLGPYYAMFPIEFAEEVVTTLSTPGDTVIDPFCGRGTTPYISMVYRRQSIGCDINPVAWIYSKTKTDPYPRADAVIRRIGDIRDAVNADDLLPRNQFQELAWCRIVLGFIKAARRELDWRNNQLDRTVAAFLLLSLHIKLGDGLSNQMRHSRSMSPDYCVRWWRANNYTEPPEIEPKEFLAKRVLWRYGKGIPEAHQGRNPRVVLRDSTLPLPKPQSPVKLVLTSPPYSNVTNYHADNWLRLWAINEGPELPDWDTEQKFANPHRYLSLLRDSFSSTLQVTDETTVWFIRSDARDRTKTAIISVMRELLPENRLYERSAPYEKKTQTALYGDTEPKPGEVDLLWMPPKRRRNGFTLDFEPVPN